MKVLLFILLIILLKKGYDIMSQTIKGVTVSSLCVLYASCILEDTIEFSRVPKVLKADVAFILVSWEQQDLITDEEIKAAAIARYEEACKNSEE